MVKQVGGGQVWRWLGFFLGLAWLHACATAPPPPPPEPPPGVVEVVKAPEPVPPPPVYVRVTGSALNVRESASTKAASLAKARKGDRLLLLGADGEWFMVQLTPALVGYVHGKYVKKEEPCLPDKSTAEILNEPDGVLRAASADRVVLEATVSTRGEVTAVKLLDNSTGNESLRKQAEDELRALRFSPPVRDCKPRSFIYVYTRAF